ncbi:MAG: M23 family metallopeptidase [Actinobacteria bacterium]|nr:M23 family metallopeptidase [Actinomycetota bacterium]
MLKPSLIYCHSDSTKVPFIAPLDGPIIVKFRETYFYEERQKYLKHTGVDIEGKPGQKVVAAGNGTVTYIGFSPIGGRTLVIKHNQKIKTTYLNLSCTYVSVGSYVKQGQIIASIGAEDDPSSETCHLHFGIIYEGKYLNPEDVLKIDYKSISRFLRLEYIESDFKLN